MSTKAPPISAARRRGRLGTELKRVAREDEAVPGHPSAFGGKYEIRSRMTGPRGDCTVLSVWIIPGGESVPRLVTAYIE